MKLKLLKMKKVMFTAVVVGLGLTANFWAQVPSYVSTNGLVGWLPFSGNANDESGNGNNGTVNGATLTTDRFGNAGNAYNFDGVGDKIIIANSPNFILYRNNWSSGNVTSNENSFTLSAWILPIGDSSKCLFSKRNYTSFQSMIKNNGTIHNAITILDSINNNASINLLNNWQNITIIWDFPTLKTYINAMLVDSASNFSFISTANPSDFEIGYWDSNEPLPVHHSPWDGKIDDIGIWNRALTECEIADLYNAQLGSFSNSSVSINPSLSSIGSNATLTVSTPLQNIQWQSNPGNMGWNNVVNNNTYSGSNNDTLVISNLQLSNHNQPFRLLACGDTSNIATIQIADTCITNVTVYDTLLTTVTDTLIINTTLSLPAPNNANTIKVYPNPASDHITIDNGNYSAMAGYSIKITNNAGQQVFQSTINQQQFYVDLSTWNGNGLYFVHLFDPQNNTVTVRKIVLQ